MILIVFIYFELALIFYGVNIVVSFRTAMAEFDTKKIYFLKGVKHVAY